MRFYDGAGLTRIVNKVLGKTVNFWLNSLHTCMGKDLQFCMQILLGLGINTVQHWLDMDIVGRLPKKIIDCQKGDHLKDPELVLLQPTELYLYWWRLKYTDQWLFCAVKIRNVWEVLSGQHRTNAGDEFVNGVQAVESEWFAQLGRTLCPVFYRKIPLHLAKRLSAGFQESKPQVSIVKVITSSLV